MSISINNFGWRLGNQLFQLAAAISLAEDNMDNVAFPEWKYAKYFRGDFTPSTSEIDIVYTQHGFNYSPIKYSQNMAIDGYFQSEKFFHNNRNLIRKYFTFKDYNPPARDGRICGIHVRRGDYLNYPSHHPTKNLSNYYNDAIDIIKNEVGNSTIFLIFSDDIEWCKAEFDNRKDLTVFYSEGKSDVEDLLEMTYCDAMIIANSSYSWWGAWLGNHRTVIAPKDWFGPAYSFFDTSDLIPDRWIKV